MKNVVIVADDFGLCESVNKGIARAYKEGVVSEVSLMLGSPGTEHALELIKERGIQHVGIHLLLKHWREWGDIYRRSDYAKLFESTPAAQIKQLVKDELAEFEMLTGKKPSHITSQYGIIVNPKVYEAAVEYALANNIPMRLPVQALYQDEPVLCLSAKHYIEEHGIDMPESLFGHVLGEEAEVHAAFLDDLDSIASHSAEILLHPGEDSAELRQLSSLAAERARDLRLALSPGFKKQIEDAGFKITSFAEAAAPAAY